MQKFRLNVPFEKASLQKICLEAPSWRQVIMISGYGSDFYTYFSQCKIVRFFLNNAGGLLQNLAP